MILGIEASNITDGGGLNHLIELLSNLNLSSNPIKKIVIWSSNETLNSIPNSEGLIKKTHPWLNSTKKWRLIWQLFKFKKEISTSNINLLFVPGGVYLGTYVVPVVSMSQNMLLYEWKEMARYGFSLGFFRLVILYFLQSYTFIRSSSILFLTNYAKATVSKKLRLDLNKSQVIPHGINLKFNRTNKLEFNFENKKIEVLYVSFIGIYKHQWYVIEAIAKLRSLGYNIQLTLIGKVVDKLAEKKFLNALNHFDPLKNYVVHKTDVIYSNIHDEYSKADIFVYSSSCENMPMILMEAMRSGLPIVSSNFGPMPEVLGEAGEYFDPTKPVELVNSLEMVIKNSNRRKEMSELAYKKSLNFDWQKTQNLTFDFFINVYSNK